MNYLWRSWFRGILLELIFYGGLLLIPALALNERLEAVIGWWHAWVFLAVVMMATTLTLFIVFPGREDLLRERSKPLIQPGQPLADQILVICFLLAFLGQVLIVPLDLYLWQCFEKPPLWLSSMGLIIFALGWWLISLVFQQNAYASSVVKHQKERGHQVVDSGVYRIVRNPMYLGFVLLYVGMPLWLESYTALIASLVPTAVLMLRILNEEQFLKEVLPGYADYMKHTRYRLFPFLW